MNRKERLKLTRTPEKNFVYADESLFLPSPTPKKYIEKEEEDILPFRVVNNNSWKSTLKKYLIYFIIAIPYVLMALFYFYGGKDQVPKQKVEEVPLNNISKKMYNVARIELGTNVIVEKGLYKYGLYGLRFNNDPNTILNDNLSPGDCLAIQNDSGLIKINFKAKMVFSRIGIYHPETGNQESAVKEFEVLGEDDTVLGKFTYDVNKSKYQSFDFTPTNTNSIQIKILSNNGCKKYTTLYKVFVYGKFE
jgi:hypothetical protein